MNFADFAATTMSAAWPGAGLLVSFTGPTLILSITDTPNASFPGGDYIDVWIDGVQAAAPVAITAGGSMTITSAAGAGAHKAEIYKATDANIGTITVTLGAAGAVAGTPFTVANGNTLVPPPRRSCTTSSSSATSRRVVTGT